MKSQSLDKKAYLLWDKFVVESDDAWFWHTTDWMEYTREYYSDKFKMNCSFFIKENGETVAICPLIIEKGHMNDREFNQFCYADDSMPALAIKSDIGFSNRQKIIEFYWKQLNKIAAEEDVEFINIKIPSLARTYIDATLPMSNPFSRYGFIDLPVKTQIIDLRNSLEYLWGDVRKGHKSDIKSAAKVIKIKVWDSANITNDKFNQYQLLHHKDAGRITRPKKTFDLMYHWIKSGNAILSEAVFEGRPIGFALVIVYKNGAYYGSSCKEPDHSELASSHLIQWETIKYLKSNGVIFYDIGVQDFGQQWFRNASEKDINIAKFKRGFGGTAVPVLISEYYFSKELMRDKFLERMNKNCSLDFKKAKT